MNDEQTDPHRKKELKQILEEWTGKSIFVTLFDTDIDEFSSRSFWRSIKGRSNVMILIQTCDNYLFGSYHSTLPECQEKYREDNDHFVFTIRNPKNYPPTKFTIKKDWKHRNLYVYGDDQISDVFFVFGCFLICNNNESFIKTIFNSAYTHDWDVDASMFVGNVWDNYFDIERLLCIQFI